MRTAHVLSLSFVVAVVAAACGGGQTNTQTPSGGEDAAAPTASSAAPVEDAGPPKPSMESQREPFIQTCMHKIPVQTYCSCAFDQFQDVFKDADLTQKPSPEALATLRQKTSEICGAKLTDADVKPLFSSACVGSEPRKQAFCDCWWTSFRKKISPGDFLGDFEGDKFDDLKKNMATTCKGKLPDAVAKAEFIDGCEKSAPGKNKFCECSWKKVRAKASPEQVAIGLVDLKSLKLEECKNAK